MTPAERFTLASANFGFLAAIDPVLARYGGLAEHYFALEPRDAVVKLRQMAEHMAQQVAARAGLAVAAEDGFLDLLRRLERQEVLPREAAALFHHLRVEGNRAVHDHGLAISHGTALHFLKGARALAVWFYRFARSDPGFNPGPFVPPADPLAAEQSVRDELERLRAELAEHGEALADARRLADERAALVEEERRRLSTVAEERDVFAALAEEAEARLADERSLLDEVLAEATREAAAAGAETVNDRVAAGFAAAQSLDLDEADTRRIIDAQLRAAGWQADSERLTHAAGARPHPGANLAIAEWPTSSGPADYVLFAGRQAVAVVEAKRHALDAAGVLEQAKRYSRDLLLVADAAPAGGPWGPYRAPFLFASNGRPYLKQLETKSGIWFLDARRPQNHPRALDGWYTPEGLGKELAKDVDAATATLSAEPPDYLPLRDYQVQAVRAVEQAIAAGRRNVLVAMATGTGKTRTCIGLVYRLIKAGRFRRVLFLVDRSALGEQAAGAFKDVRLEQLQSFTDIYDVKELGDLAPDADTRLHLATVQGMIQRILYPAEGEPAAPVDRYDCIVVDECHRGYNLDREMTEAELAFRSQADYLSTYRRVIEHFDAVRIGLTATPALHTTEIFGEPVFQYSYRDAVLDGFLVDHEPPVRITTRLATEGIHWAAGEAVTLYDPSLGQLELWRTPDELDFEVDQFNRTVVTESFNRVVCAELTRHVDPDLPGKTLVFCATDHHAQMVVGLLKQAFDEAYGGIDDDAVAKITGNTDRPNELIRRFKNERDPRIAVTVDLLTTGIDVPEIVNLVFLRRVRSRILYEQMLGRATRLCPEIGKESFRIFDAVDLYSILENVTQMKPVAPDPGVTFALLAELLTKPLDPHQQAQVHQQLIARLQAKKRMLDEHHGAEIRHHTGGTAEELVRRLRGLDPAEAARWLGEHPALVAFLDAARRPGPRLVVSQHPDEVVAVTTSWGEYQRPEDYLDAFGAFVRDHLNLIPALAAVVQRPRDLTREQLREVLAALEAKGFTEQGVAAAFREARNQDIAATIIGYIRTQALGSPLEPYAARIDRALSRILSRAPWTAPQRRWLERIAQQLKAERIVDRRALDEGEFRRQGGFARLDKIFEGNLETVMARLSEEVWSDLRDTDSA